MKSIRNKLYIALLALSFLSCETVVDVNLPQDEPSLVVEGNIDFSPDNIQDTVSVKLTMTTGFYEKEIPKVHNAKVWIEDGKGTRNILSEVNDTGIYISTEIKKDFVNNEYRLHIEHDYQVYEATEKLIQTPEIIKVTQTKEKLIGDQYYVIRVYYQDTPTESSALNYYFRSVELTNEVPHISVQSNEHSKGNIMESMIADKDYKVGDKLVLNFHQVSRNYYDFLLALQSNMNNGGGPFQTPTGRLKGNVKNLTKPDKNTTGYFRVTEKRQVLHVITE